MTPTLVGIVFEHWCIHIIKK